MHRAVCTRTYCPPRMPVATIWQAQGQQRALNIVVPSVRSPATSVLSTAKSVSYNVYLVNVHLPRTSLSHVHFVLHLQPLPLYIWTHFHLSHLRKYPVWIPYPLAGTLSASSFTAPCPLLMSEPSGGNYFFLSWWKESSHHMQFQSTPFYYIDISIESSYHVPLLNNCICVCV